ncbi:MAG: hypothetical protein E7302_00275 [Butyrivibrio sp.]|nr:hypothetical protein [Butyrivibrio sp.]
MSELLGMMSALTHDNRFVESYDKLKGKECVNMCEVLDEVEARGIAIGETKGEDRLSKLITILLEKNDNSAIALVTSDKKTRDEYYKKYNL